MGKTKKNEKKKIFEIYSYEEKDRNKKRRIGDGEKRKGRNRNGYLARFPMGVVTQ